MDLPPDPDAGLPLDPPLGGFAGDGTPHAAAKGSSSSPDSVFNLMQTSGSVRIVKAFHKIKSRKARELLVGMVEQMAEA